MKSPLFLLQSVKEMTMDGFMSKITFSSVFFRISC